MALRKVSGLLTQGDRCSSVTFEGGQMANDAVVQTMGLSMPETSLKSSVNVRCLRARAETKL